jgi:hypothetical protein
VCWIYEYPDSRLDNISYNFNVYIQNFPYFVFMDATFPLTLLWLILNTALLWLILLIVVSSNIYVHSARVLKHEKIKEIPLKYKVACLEWQTVQGCVFTTLALLYNCCVIRWFTRPELLVGTICLLSTLIIVEANISLYCCIQVHNNVLGFWQITENKYKPHYG